MLQIKQDDEDLIPTFSDNEAELIGIARDRIIRRRSSKACDQCRRAKSKCLRYGDQPCQNCATLGVECTFLGPSRKRGPAKGYLSDLELKLHQMEALIGVLLASDDPRATSLIADMSQDSAARDILNRVDTSLVGTHPRGNPELFNPRTGSSSVGKRIASELADSTQEWQKHLQHLISKTAAASDRSFLSVSDTGIVRSLDNATGLSAAHAHTNSTSSLLQHAPRPIRPPVTVDLTKPDSRSSSPTRRRRLEPLTPLTGSPGVGGGSSGDPSASRRDALSTTHSGRNTPDYSDSEDLHDALGQLSLDDASQIRYHGKASGLHLLGSTERTDRRAEGGIWHFPPARVWPPTERPIERARVLFASDFGVQLPTPEQQKMLLDIYFAHINPCLPLFDKETFLKAWSIGIDESSDAAPVATFVPSRLPMPLMLVIFSIAMRLEFEAAPEPLQGTMSSTGDEYLSAAKYMITANPYAASRPALCATYLLIAYREIGIGAMSQAWIFLGVGIRMAQDLGLHRSVDKFPTVAASLFSQPEKEARNRTWWCCVILDRYISTYIGRPCMIFERDYDTSLPVESPQEAKETWSPWVSMPPQGSVPQDVPPHFYNATSHAIAAFNASCRLSSILGQIVESLYSVKRAIPSRHTESNRIENVLDTFYLDLPGYLKCDLSGESTAPIPPPHVLTLNLQYWNTVLLLHRPFMLRRASHHRDSPEAVNSPADSDTLRASASRAFQLCKLAAAHVSRLSQIYRKNFCLRRSSPFLCYYVFSAAVMHVVVLTQQMENFKETLSDVRECMDTLKAMSTLWPSAGRAWELVNGCRATTRKPEQPPLSLISKLQHGVGDGYSSPYTQNPMLARAQSLSHLRPRDEYNAARPQSIDTSIQSRSMQGLHPPHSAFPHSQSYSPQNSTEQLFGPWTGSTGGDMSYIRSTFDSASPAHSRSASVGSQREPITNQPMPHFWTDPFTDTSLLTSNYYGLPQMVDRRGQLVAGDHLGGPHYNGLSYVPYDGAGF